MRMKSANSAMQLFSTAKPYFARDSEFRFYMTDPSSSRISVTPRLLRVSIAIITE